MVAIKDVLSGLTSYQPVTYWFKGKTKKKVDYNAGRICFTFLDEYVPPPETTHIVYQLYIPANNFSNKEIVEFCNDTRELFPELDIKFSSIYNKTHDYKSRNCYVHLDGNRQATIALFVLLRYLQEWPAQVKKYLLLKKITRQKVEAHYLTAIMYASKDYLLLDSFPSGHSFINRTNFIHQNYGFRRDYTFQWMNTSWREPHSYKGINEITAPTVGINKPFFYSLELSVEDFVESARKVYKENIKYIKEMKQ